MPEPALAARRPLQRASSSSSRLIARSISSRRSARRLGAAAVAQRGPCAGAQHDVDAPDPLQLVGRRDEERRGAVAVAAADVAAATRSARASPAPTCRPSTTRSTAAVARDPPRERFVDGGEQHDQLRALPGAGGPRRAARRARDLRCARPADRPAPDRRRPGCRPYGGHAGADRLDRRRADHRRRREVRRQPLGVHMLQTRRRDRSRRARPPSVPASRAGGRNAPRASSAGRSRAERLPRRKADRPRPASAPPPTTPSWRRVPPGESRHVAERIAGAAAGLDRAMDLGGVEDRAAAARPAPRRRHARPREDRAATAPSMKKSASGLVARSAGQREDSGAWTGENDTARIIATASVPRPHRRFVAPESPPPALSPSRRSSTC